MNVLSAEPEIVLFNASVYTVQKTLRWAEAIAVQSGKIVAVGDSSDVRKLAARHTRCIDLGGRLVLPGLCDAHIHFYDWSLGLRQLYFAATRSKREMLEMTARRSHESAADKWIVGRGWNESWWGDSEYPSARDLDAVTGPNQPAVFWRTDMHAAVANSRALALAGIGASTPDPRGGFIERDSQGQPTGVLKELAIALVSDLIPPPTDSEVQAAMRDGICALHRMGVTTIHDQRMKDHDDGIQALVAYQDLNQRGELALRVNCNLTAHQLPALKELGLSYGFGDDRLRLGHIKVFADGSLGSQTALMEAPFEKSSPDEPDNLGIRLTDPAEMADTFRTSAEHGFPISVHAIGDQANHEVLNIFEELRHSTPTTRAPHRIEHAQMLQETDVARLADLGVTASVQPVHVIDDIEIAERILGDRSARLYRFSSLLSSGTLLAFGSDAPVADPNPFLGIHAALYRQKPTRMQEGSWYADECITLEQAIYAYTMGAARASGWHNEIGSIELGKHADLIALDRDLFQLDADDVQCDEIASSQVEFVMFNGEVVYDRL